jgi:CBS-domain-containing membrane protein
VIGSDVIARDVKTVGPGADVAEAARLMAQNDLSALPVVDDKRLVGIISEADLLRREELGTEVRRPRWMEAMIPATTLAAEFAKAHGKQVNSCLKTCKRGHSARRNRSHSGAPPHQAHSHHPRDALVGMVSRANLIQALLWPNLSRPRN